MEDTLREEKKSLRKKLRNSLNPCFNGRYSQSNFYIFKKKKKHSLNPCFNGRYSQSAIKKEIESTGSLNPCFNGRYSQRAKTCVPLFIVV